MTLSPVELEQATKGIKYPASRQDLVKQAQSNNADHEVVDEIKDLPDQEYSSPIDVTKAFGQG